MIDKELFKLIGGNKKYIFTAVLTQVIGLVANVAVTGSVCYAVYLLTVSRRVFGVRLSANRRCFGYRNKIYLFAIDRGDKGQARKAGSKKTSERGCTTK